MSEYVIETRNLTKYYGESLGIENLDLKISRGEIYGFLGPNGAGKTTTIRLLLNLIKPTSGKALLFNCEVSKNYYKVFNNVGVLPGELSHYEGLTGEYFLNYMNKFSPKPATLQNQLIKDFSLSSDDMKKKIRFYSHGMKQKLGLIQALQEQPDLLVFDEPTKGLDPLNKNVLYDYLNKFRMQNKTVFFSSHNLSEVEKLCDRVGLVKDSRLITDEPLESLKENMVRRMYIMFNEPYDHDGFFLEGVEVIEHSKYKIELLIKGDINPLLKILAGKSVKNLIFPEPSLEDTFLTYYHKEIGNP